MQKDKKKGFGEKNMFSKTALRKLFHSSAIPLRNLSAEPNIASAEAWRGTKQSFLSFVKVLADGRVDCDDLKRQLDAVPVAARPQTLLSIMAANNETGVLQPLDDIAEIA